MKEISVFEPQEINGETVDPLCIPALDTTISQTVAGATNLLWFAFHLSLAEGNQQEAIKLAEMLKIAISDEVCEGFHQELDDAINMLDETQEDEYSDEDETQYP
jgi:hypothetical protein